MKVFGLAGWSGSGKTTLMVKLVAAMAERGLKVSTIKHAHHDFDIDQPGKDSYRHRAAGASEVLIASGRRWALMHELGDAPEPTLPELLSRLSPVDLVLVEGFKFQPHPKLEIHRPAIGKAPLWTDDPNIVAVASDAALPEIGLPLLHLDDHDAIAEFILARVGLA